jgi:putative tryptophan/tyrosine transport system substrate-binding protein
MIRRRKFITFLGGAAAAWPLGARAQQQVPVPVIGYLSGGASGGMPGERPGFQQGLKEIGLLEGRDFAIEYHSAGDRNDRLPAMVADVVARRVMVIVAVSDSYALAAKAATTSIPIVYVGGNDPVRIGLVTSLNRPEGNVTGVTVLNVEIAAKRLQLLHELIPASPTIAALLDPGTPNFEIDSKNLLAVANLLGVQVDILPAGNSAEIVFALEAIVERRLMVRHALPAIFQTRDFVAAGGLMSYGGSLLDVFRIAGTYTGRILKGDKPANLPVQQGSKFELFINLKTAKALGLEVPPTLLARADEVIE